MTNEEKAEEYLRKGVCQGCSSICEGDCAYAKPVRQAHLDGLAEGGKEKQIIIDTQTCQIESRDVYLAKKESIIIRQQTEIQKLEKENEQLKAYESHWEEIEEDAKRIAEENAELKAEIKKLRKGFLTYHEVDLIRNMLTNLMDGWNTLNSIKEEAKTFYDRLYEVNACEYLEEEDDVTISCKQ